MNNNYVFQRLIATFDLSRNHDLINKVFKLAGHRQDINKSLVKSWRTHDVNNRNYKPMPDDALILFFNGLQEAGKEGLIGIYISETDNDEST